MKKQQALARLSHWDKANRFVFSKRELKKLFPDDNSKTLSEGLARLVKANILRRVCSGIYLNPHAHSIGGHTLESIAKALRAGHYNYVSLESMLSEYGVISQIPTDRLTVMTTGRKGIYKTEYGVIEFTHTKRSVANILQSTKKTQERPLRVATKLTAWRDLKRVGRNTQLVDMSEINNDE